MSTEVKERPTVEKVETPVPEKPVRHLARMSERRWDGTVDTFCGLRRTIKPPKPNAEKCEKCLEVLEMIRHLDRL